VTRRFLLLDRDGTLIEDRDYAHELSDYRPLPGAYQAVTRARAAGFGAVVLTNQSGVARGFFGEADLARFHAHLLADFAAHGAPLDAVYHCPHLPHAGCDCRKPKPGLALRAQREHDIDFAGSVVIGDKASDVVLGLALGCVSILVGSGRAVLPSGALQADDVLDAVTRFALAPQRR
jgi:D-glycero-D-manno-heptose 1,7-bisphosphate phosphatase